MRRLKVVCIIMIQQRAKRAVVFGFEGIPSSIARNCWECRVFSWWFAKQNIFLDSSMVEHSAVNRVVVGSSPTRGAKRGTNPMLFKAPWSSG